MENKPYTNEEFKRDTKEILWQNRLQTVALLSLFFFGVSTIFDLKKKLK